MNVAIAIKVDASEIAKRLIESGDLYKDEWSEAMAFEDEAREIEELVELFVDTIAPFGAAGFRALSDKARDHAAHVEADVRAKLARGDLDLTARARLSVYEQNVLYRIALRLGSKARKYNRLSDLVSAGHFTSLELYGMNPSRLNKLLK